MSGFLGSLYSLIQGYGMAFLFKVFGSEYIYTAIEALIITIIVILVMMFLYRHKIIKVNKKFTSFILTIFALGIIISLIYVILSFIPALNGVMNYISSNSTLFIITSIISVLISALFLLVDFEVINNCIENKISKKYEWLAAFCLSFSVIEVYIRILNILNSVKDN